MRHRPSNLDLLAAEIDIIFGIDSRGREEPPSVVVGDAGTDNVVFVRDDVPVSMSDRIGGIVADTGLPKAARLVQQALTETIGEVEETVGPSYICNEPAPQPAPVAGRLLVSDETDPAELDTVANPPTWDENEWERLLHGQVGPWAMLIDDDQMLSMCHSARMAPGGLEAGIWTADHVRGQGLAAACTQAWARACRALPGEVFFSTDAYNIASQRVAARLELPPIGQLWKFRLIGEDVPPADAKLTRLR
jgi:RimJ/RimL family protein N-acetyltransferase